MTESSEYLRHVLAIRKESAGKASPEECLARHLRGTSGHVLVTGRRSGWAESLLESALTRVDSQLTVTVSAADGLGKAMDAILGTEADEVSTPADRRIRLVDAIQAGKRAEKPILVVISDADSASVEELERVRVGIDVDAGETVRTLRLVLVGTRTLAVKLSTPAARGLRSRITADVEACRPSRDQRRKGSRTQRRGIRAAALAAILVVLGMIPPLQALFGTAIDRH